MDTLTSERRLSAFRATDAYAIEAYRLTVTLEGRGAGLPAEIRRTVVRCGGALVAASAAPEGSVAEREQLSRAQLALAESRYHLYLARRFGLLDRRRYRSLTVRQDAAMREISSLIGERLEGGTGRFPAPS